MVALDDGGLAAQTALDDVGIDGALCQEIHLADLLGLFLEDTDELLADDLALALRLGNACQLAKITLTSIHADEVDVKVGVAGAEDGADLFLFVLAEQAVIHENAGQLLADRLGQHSCQDRGIHAAGQSAQHLAVSDLFPQGLDVVLHERVHLPVARAAADVVHEVVQHLLALGGVQNFRMELDGIQALLCIFRSGHRAVHRMRRDSEIGCCLLNVVVVAHPADGGGLNIREHLAGIVHEDLRFAVFTLRCTADMTAQQVHHQLAAVADAQDGHTPVEDLRVDRRGILQIDAVGAASEDDALRVLGLDQCQIRLVGIDFTVDIVLADAAGDQLVVLAAEIQNDHGFVLHDILLPVAGVLL